MDLNHLNIFVTLAETLNYSKTAKLMHISQPAVSQIISSMEIEVGVTLFNRNHRQVELTKNGQIFYQNIKAMLNSYNKTIQETRQAFSREQSNISIGATGTPFEQEFLPKLLFEFKQKYPKIKVFLEYYNHNLLKDHLLKHDNDLIFDTKDDIGATEDLEFHELKKGYFTFLVPTGSTLSNLTQLTLSDLNHQSMILLDKNWCPNQQWKIQEEIRKNVPTLDISYANNVQVATTLVRAGVGITIMPDFIADSNLKKIRLNQTPTLHYGLVELNLDQNDAKNKFIKHCKEFFDKYF